MAGRRQGVSRGEAAAALPWQKTKIHELFARLRAAGRVELRPPEGRNARYYAMDPVVPAVPDRLYPPLQVVRDAADDDAEDVS